MNKDLLLDVEHCARCHDTHVQLSFRPFMNPVVVDNRQYEYWAECPNTHEPILCLVIHEDTELAGAAYAPN